MTHRLVLESTAIRAEAQQASMLGVVTSRALHPMYSYSYSKTLSMKQSFRGGLRAGFRSYESLVIEVYWDAKKKTLGSARSCSTM